ncbi:hypothetical protein IRP63_14155 (plasmid) [Clostridium botulinum]|uniref:Uncharacterized protein n=1 Tax=Clostridium botulinum C/D str. DC5 TaxID=1443128 RepID=A0A0A0HWH0_CLOBO|nr:hypothetical protein [Clostridium botulinum]KGM93534.1 hypothetical protein Z955_14845 [Clostridium botulinum C/D str. DC5]KOC56866.1 hypothetical protein ADU89_01320 [Clostridium botulinum]KOC57341.1 hypothetical protein ADU90_05860 [Clostridium botulinum]MCD3232571.1 hypothetical protein [Clostridium botulinum D/C]MCD3238500.1 hypothetical protein [Clostridium botulinum D/C]
MYYTIVKRRADNNEYVKIVKSYLCFGRTGFDMEYKAKCMCGLYNLLRNINKKYYYVVEFDFE